MTLVNWHDRRAACAELKRLDAKFNTGPDSPLHHDNRCELHQPKFLVESAVVVTVH